MSSIPPRSDRNDPDPFFTYGEPCENCGCACESRVWIPGFEYFGCNDCATEAAIVVYAEQNCETLYNAVMRSKSVAEVQKAFREHEQSCPHCMKVNKKAQRENGYQKERAA